MAALQQFAERDRCPGVRAQQCRVCREAARLPQVREHGALVLPLLGTAVQLGDGNHRDVKFLGEQLE